MARLSHTCSTCGAELDEGTECPSCGTAVTTSRVTTALQVVGVVGIGYLIGEFGWETLGKPTAWLSDQLVELLPVTDADLDPNACVDDGSLTELACQARTIALASLGAILVPAILLVFRRQVGAVLGAIGRLLPRVARPVVGPVVAAVVFTMAYADLQDNALGPLSGRSPLPDAIVPAAVALATYLAALVAARARRSGRSAWSWLPRVPAFVRVAFTIGVAFGLGLLVGSSTVGGAAGLALRSQLTVVGISLLAALMMAPFKTVAAAFRSRQQTAAAGVFGMLALVVVAPALAQTGDGVSVTASVSGPYDDGTYLVVGTVTPTFPPLDQPGEVRTASVWVDIEVMGSAGGQWPAEYEWWNHALECHTIGERCMTEAERDGVGLVGGGSAWLDEPDPLVSGASIPFEASVDVPDDGTQIRVVAGLRHTWRGTAAYWDARHFTWATAGPFSVDGISPTGLPPEYLGGAIGLTAAIAAILSATIAAAAAAAVAAGAAGAGAASSVAAVGATATTTATGVPTLVDPDTGQVLPVDGDQVWYGEWMSPAEAQQLIGDRIDEIRLDQDAAAAHQQFVQHQQDIRRQELDDLGFVYDAATNTWKPGPGTLDRLDQQWQDKIAQDPAWQREQQEFQEIQQLLDAEKGFLKQLWMADQQTLNLEYEYQMAIADEYGESIEYLKTVKSSADTGINLLGEIPGGPRYIKWAYNSLTTTIEKGPLAGAGQLSMDVMCDLIGDKISLQKMTGGFVDDDVIETSFYEWDTFVSDDRWIKLPIFQKTELGFGVQKVSDLVGWQEAINLSAGKSKSWFVGNVANDLFVKAPTDAGDLVGTFEGAAR